MSRAPPQEQAAAIVRVKAPNGFLVLLVSSRGTGRWIVPKGWIGRGSAKGKGSRHTALIEAWEEGGVRGRSSKNPLGFYETFKDEPEACGEAKSTTVIVHLVDADAIAAEWPEKAERRRIWVTPEEAAEMLSEPSLAALVRASAFTKPLRKSKRGTCKTGSVG
jgi:8-oxo-dGTP pyrophosphatase MutT (NUDIX family)